MLKSFLIGLGTLGRVEIYAILNNFSTKKFNKLYNEPWAHESN